MSILTTIASTAASALSAVTSRWRIVALGLGGVLLVLILTGVAAWRGYRAGYDKADALRRAEVGDIRAAHAQALAEAEAEARRRLADAVARAAVAEGRYLAATKTIAAQRREITKERIADASRTAVAGGCLFGPEWVRLYNQAIGAGAGDGGDAVPTAAPGADNATRAAPAADAGVLRQVTPEDILAHIRDYGARCQRLEAQLRELIDWAKGLGEGAR
ncbi:hypothetical protein [Pseudodesulfovibrio sp.]|uniref:hypothetical protein n=1 Tax=Pseudodesulfovibrio sp. TaxID=2035812 RepID=UPI002623D8D0|nr:hypothetical protein [Pseudodesulfovibrio sp.]MDD3310969.1 hypothetical protein [Pseudodesulfovibrio sp.]